jgi:hypothetical protein
MKWREKSFIKIIFSLSFFLDKKETKNQGSKTPAAHAEAT